MARQAGGAMRVHGCGEGLDAFCALAPTYGMVTNFRDWLEHISSWYMPDLARERDELVRQAADLGIPLGDMVRAFEAGRLVTLGPGVWSGMLNTESNDPDLSLEMVKTWRDKDVGGITRALAEGLPLPAPIVLRHGGRHWCVAGNTRLCLSKLMGVTPKVWMIEV